LDSDSDSDSEWGKQIALKLPTQRMRFGLFLVRAGSVAAQVDNDVDNDHRNDDKHDDESEPKPLEQRIKSPLSSMWRRL